MKAQVGIGTTSPDQSAILDVTSDNKGMLIPRMNTTERDNIIDPANSLLIYNTDSDEIQINTNSPATPIWEAFSLTPVSTAAPGDSMKYSNTDTTTDLNVTPAIDLPVFGSLDWNDNTTLFQVSGNEVLVNQTGRYDITVNVSLEDVANGSRKAPEIRIAVNGIPRGTFSSTGYIRSNNNHAESSLHIREIFELTSGDVISVQVERAAAANLVTMRSVGSSNFYIEKLR